MHDLQSVGIRYVKADAGSQRENGCRILGDVGQKVRCSILVLMHTEQMWLLLLLM